MPAVSSPLRFSHVLHVQCLYAVIREERRFVMSLTDRAQRRCALGRRLYSTRLGATYNFRTFPDGTSRRARKDSPAHLIRPVGTPIIPLSNLRDLTNSRRPARCGIRRRLSGGRIRQRYPAVAGFSRFMWVLSGIRVSSGAGRSIFILSPGGERSDSAGENGFPTGVDTGATSWRRGMGAAGASPSQTS